MIIYQLERGETADYASSELAKYIKAICGEDAEIKLEKGNEPGITLALFDKLGISYEGLDDPNFDDSYHIDIKGFDGYIAASNIRTILYGVYGYLYETGCRFFRPGKDGEYIPQKDLSAVEVQLTKTADLRYRSDCIEGSLSLEMIEDRIEWLPKVGFNSYLIQGTVPTNMLDRWYAHQGNKYKQDEAINLTWKQKQDITAKIEKAIKKHGLLFHDLGHEYLFPAFGVHEDSEVPTMDESIWSHIALVNGERVIHHRSIKYTNFCYSDPVVWEKVADYLVKYVKEKPEIDLLHLWLADNSDNTCQCEECSKVNYSDTYIKLLNYVDEQFTKNNIDTKIVFILYLDTQKPPVKEVIKNPERFVMTIALGGCVWFEAEKGYSVYDYDNDIDQLDILGEPTVLARAMRDRKGWERAFKGDVFFYDYHMYSVHLNDMGHKYCATRLARDAQFVKTQRANGLMNCCTPRVYMPTGLPPYLCGLSMFDNKLDVEAERDDYFVKSFGEDGMKAKEYLDSLSDYFLTDMVSFIGVSAFAEEFTDETELKTKMQWMYNPEAEASFKKAKETVKEFLPVIEKNLKLEHSCHRESWRILRVHHELCLRLADALIEGAAGDMTKAHEKCYELIDYLALHEDEYAPYFDFFLYYKRLRFMFGMTGSVWAAF